MPSAKEPDIARPPRRVPANDTRDEKSNLLATTGVTEDRHLTGERVYFPDDQFNEQALASLVATAQSLGAEIVEDWDASTLVFHNPCHPDHASLLHFASERARQHPNTPKSRLIPYHYLSLLSLYPDTRPSPPPSDLPTQNPYIIHPDRSLNYKPLTVWVSINIHKQSAEQPQEARDKIMKSLLLGGGIPVEKRAHADVLIVDQTTKFYQGTILGEMRKHGRGWKLAERDWVEACERLKRVPKGWVGTLGVDEVKDEESFGEMELPVGKGPGRPTGKPRVEYTPQDDDFLCRYLAARHPEGSWHSRKTYALLADSQNVYPIAARHSEQSWMERFKKSANAMSNRTRRFMEAGIDDSLKTEEERAKAAALLSGQEVETRSTVTQVVEGSMQRIAEGNNTARKEGARLTNIAAQHVDSVGVATIAIPSNAPAEPSRSVPEPVRTSVELNGATEESPIDNAEVGARQAVAPDTTTPAAEVSNESEPRQIRKLVEESDDEEEQSAPVHGIPALIPETFIEPAQSLAVTRHAGLEGNESVGSSFSRGLVPPVLGVSAGDKVDSMAPALPDANTDTDHGLQESHSTDSRSQLRGEETQAVLRDYAARQGHGRKKSVHLDVDAIEQPRQRSRTPHIKPSITASPPKSQRSPQIRPASELIRTRQSLPVTVDYGQGQGSYSNGKGGYSVNIAVNVTPNEGPSERRRETTQGRIERYETPSRTGSGILGPDLEGVPSSRKRKRLSSSRRHRHSSPDTVYAFTSLPPPPPRSRPSTTPRRTPAPREASPPLSHRQREAKALAGEQLVQDVKEGYKRRIEGFSEKYGVGPSEIFGLVNGLEKVRGGVYWDDVERGLRAHFGF